MSLVNTISSTFVPIPGLGTLFLSPSSFVGMTLSEAEHLVEAERQRALPRMGEVGQGDHTIVLHSTNYPYRMGAIAPPSILPVPAGLAARCGQVQKNPLRVVIGILLVDRAERREAR